VSDRRDRWDDSTVRTVRLPTSRELPPTFAMAPGPGELPVAVWQLRALFHGEAVPRAEHAHDFPLLAFFEKAGGPVSIGAHRWTIEPGDLFVIGPREVVGRADAAALAAVEGWAVSFTAEVLGPDVPGSHLAWGTHPLLFPFVSGGASWAMRLSVPPVDRAAWRGRIQALRHELTQRRDGFRAAALANLTLLLVEVARLAADVVDDLRVNREPLLAEVFAVIEARYPQPLSLREVAAAVNVSPGHLTSTVRRRTGRTVLDWIVERRMVQARRLLAGSELPVAEVGRRVGYPDPGYFARVFGRTHGVSPARWRASGVAR
jgi:AraC-like DNA-binding protein